MLSEHNICLYLFLVQTMFYFFPSKPVINDIYLAVSNYFTFWQIGNEFVHYHSNIFVQSTYGWTFIFSFIL